jgi:hypothetical protein
MSKPIIQTPRGKIIIDGDNKAKLIWNTNFRPKWQKKFSEAQEFVDSQVLKKSEEFVPLRTGMLIKSGILGTEIGSGEVKYIAPYARKQYYSPRKPGSIFGPQRGPFWFQRAMAIWKNKILAGAKKMMGK